MTKYFLLSLFYIFIISGCAQTETENPSNDLQQPSVQIEDGTISASGTVVPAKWANLAFFNGGKDLELFVTTGEVVRQNQQLARVNQRSAEYGIVSAEAQLANAKATLEQALESVFSSDQEVEAARAAVRAAEAGLEQAQITWVNTQLFSPFAGTIIDMYANPGEVVSPGIPLLLIADLNTLQVKTTDLNEVDVARVNVGDTAEIVFDALPDIVSSGTVVDISRRNAEVPGVYYTVTIELDQVPGSLLWGMSAFVKIDADN